MTKAEAKAISEKVGVPFDGRSVNKFADELEARGMEIALCRKTGAWVVLSGGKEICRVE